MCRKAENQNRAIERVHEKLDTLVVTRCDGVYHIEPDGSRDLRGFVVDTSDGTNLIEVKHDGDLRIMDLISRLAMSWKGLVMKFALDYELNPYDFEIVPC